MLEKIYKYFLYMSLYYSIKDKDIREFFYTNTKNTYTFWDDKKFDKLFEFVNRNYSDIEKTYTNIFYLSLPEIIILFLKEEKMLNILEEYAKSLEKNQDIYDEKEIEFENYKFIYEKLHFMYPNRF